MPNGTPRISRVNRSKEQARITYDRLSRWYDWLEGGWEKKARDIGLAKLDAIPGERVLEIGFGTGHCIVSLARTIGESEWVYGVDLSAGMCTTTQSRVGAAGVSGRVQLVQGDATSLPFRSGWFDVIFMSFALELLDTPEIPQTLHQWWTILRDGGRVCVVALSMEGESTWMRRLYEWGHRRFPTLLDCRPIFVRRELQEAGFRTLDATQVSLWGLPVEIVLADKPGTQAAGWHGSRSRRS
jgi:demethylmenaquinone methyltransferase/2-methoxy-6-polyprenyl-1,4-benzoquinol methylase